MSVHQNDLHAAAATLRETGGVAAADVLGDATRGAYVEAVMRPEYDGIPAHVVHVLADHNVTITDVSAQGEPTHYVLTIQ